MLGLVPSKFGIVDQIFNYAQEIFKHYFHQCRVQLKAKYVDLDSLDKKETREIIKNRSNALFTNLAKDISKHLPNIMNELNNERIRLSELQGLEPVVDKSPQKRIRGCTNEENLQKQIGYGISVNPVGSNQFDVEVLKFNRFQQFLQDSKQVNQVRALTVEIQSQGITDNGMIHFSEAISKFWSVESVILNLNNNSITEIGVEQLCIALGTLSNLKQLNLSFYNNKIKYKGLVFITDMLKKLVYLQDLTLELACNSIGTKGFDLIGESIYGLRNLNQLWLGFYDNQINDDGLKTFNHWFQQAPNVKVFSLDLRLNHVKKSNVDALKRIIKNQYINNFEILL